MEIELITMIYGRPRCNGEQDVHDGARGIKHTMG